MPQALDIFERVQKAFPGANVFASTFDNFTNELLSALPALDLPVVTKEIGDTWIYGEQSLHSKPLAHTCLKGNAHVPSLDAGLSFMSHPCFRHQSVGRHATKCYSGFW